MIVLVNPLSSGTDLAQALREEGADCLHLYDGAHRAAHDADTAAPARLLHRDVDATVRRLRELGCTRVVAASEYGVALADTLAGRLGLEHHRPELAAARQDKQRMLAAVAEAGLPVAASSVAHAPEEVEKILADRGRYPVVVKPRHSAGSDGCHICHSPREALRAYAAIAGARNLLGRVNDDGVLVQEHLDGVLYIVNTVSMAGRHLLGELYEKRVDRRDGAPLLRHVVSRTEPTAAERGLVAYAFGCLDALGIREGAAHTEVMLTADGPRLVEVNSRVMGPCLAPDPFFAAFGYSQQHLVAERFLRPEEFAARFALPYRPARYLARVFLRALRPGVLSAADGLRTVRRLPGFHRLTRLPAPGARVAGPHLTTGAGGIAYFVSEDEPLLRHSLDVVHAMEEAGTLFQLDAR
ncbi:ATP-grasp domain-containing protein [Streptomyces sp. TRM 70351]|uniref:ATP-grasp domain-containing protein n=1 Tax=Streptomyces sp. TRM 70351 TaxID=3116552 RepID=UPI002E7B06EE|nr:ATP-grasp domain-containing protein [Streptomyces sp. TRM 70351]MEE1927324.1 ATP-grasp domain-containing protein [Streptomyces sp. TRM 70351]